jgi:hypothetical protein
MSLTVCIQANTIAYLNGGGHRWVYVNWALGLRANGCRVIWQEAALPEWPAETTQRYLGILKEHLHPYGLDGSIALHSARPEPLKPDAMAGCISLDQASAEADLLIDVGYSLNDAMVARFKRSALVDIDPGLSQVWIGMGQMKLIKHDVYFTIGETIGQPGSRIPDLGLKWNYVPPCVSLDHWKPTPPAKNAAFTTVSQWRGGDWVVYNDESYSNEKREGFLPYVDLPTRTKQPLELALTLAPSEVDERQMLIGKGWRLADAPTVAATPWGYQKYVSESLGEFSCVKPSCVRLQNAWISDRSICYLASGKPVVVENTGPSGFLPDRSGLFRFSSLDEAATCLDQVGADYQRQCRNARALAEEYFDAKKVTASVLSRAL